MNIRKILVPLILGIFLVAISFVAGVYYANSQDLASLTPSLFDSTQQKPKPLAVYTFPQLRNRAYEARSITIEKQLSTTPEFTSYLFSFDALGKKMTGQLNIPAQTSATTPVIVMIRGYVPPEIFSTGVGTKNAAAIFAKNGFITIAPDFFGYGGSDPEPTDSWQARFEKPIVVIELIKSIREKGLPLQLQPDSATPADLYATTKIGIWGHSNGGQIAMSTLVTMQESIPTTLWAPVLAPFPYSIMYFSDESDDEGKGMRIWVSQLEDQYNLKEFSFTQYLDGLAGPLQIQHGTSDEAAPHVWSEEFIQKLKKENDRRKKLLTTTQTATTATTATSPHASAATTLTEPISFQLITYPGADHNLQPAENWNQAVQRDLTFFKEKLVDAN